jgi:pyruvate/2-oxoglutarate dehydrogenase complex dihydrolipoamide dehydrogenase (E3) component/uncharacterized membrane protein YdjX (TVP38/TMEM64 family)
MARPVVRLRLGIAALVILGILGLGFAASHGMAEWKGWLTAQRSLVAAHPLPAAALYVLAYIVFATLSLPGAWAISVAGGALFGAWAGPLLVSFSSTAGATVAMLAARYLFRDAVAQRFPDFVARVDSGVTRDGARWLFAARLTPVIPFSAVNLGMGLTRMSALTFALITMIGSFPFAWIYAEAGAQLAHVERPTDVLSLRLVLAFLALAALPFAAKGLGAVRRRRAALAGWKKPKRFDYNLVVIGAGSAGLVAAYVAATAKARVALIEQGEMGGDCLNTGCVPSKALIRAAKLAHESTVAASFGLSGRLEPDFPAIMARIRAVIAKVALHDSPERYRSLGVDVIAGRARVVDPWTVEVAGRRLSARRLVIATGGEPWLPPIPGLAEVAPLTSQTLWGLETAPQWLLMLGGGAIGCELAQAFARLGVAVTLVESAPRLLAREDEEVCALMRAALAADGVEIIEGLAVTGFAQTAGGGQATLADGRVLEFDRVLVAVGRRPRVEGFGLEELGLIEDGRLVVDESLRTKLPTIYAAGDVLGRLQFTHAAGAYGAAAALNGLFSPLRPGRAKLAPFPTVIYTDPEVARVGLNESEARALGIAYEVTRYDLAELDRALVDGAEQGFVKVLTVPGRDRILGATIVAARAGDMLGEFTLAMRHKLGLKAIFATIHPYPGWSDAARAAAGEWRRAHAPASALRLSQRLLAWARR